MTSVSRRRPSRPRKLHRAPPGPEKAAHGLPHPPEGLSASGRDQNTIIEAGEPPPGSRAEHWLLELGKCFDGTLAWIASEHRRLDREQMRGKPARPGGHAGEPKRRRWRTRRYDRPSRRTCGTSPSYPAETGRRNRFSVG
jgi:hypothetical protein